MLGIGRGRWCRLGQSSGARSLAVCGILAHPGIRRWSRSSRRLLEQATSLGGLVAERAHHFHDNDFPWTTARPAISVGMLVNRRRTLDTLDDMARSGSWMLFSGMVATGIGLAMVLGHQVWSGGALPVVVTLIGWAALLKGIVLLLVPAERVADAYKGIGLARFFHVWLEDAAP